MSKILVVGDTSERTCRYAQTIDPKAQLATVSNFDQALASSTGVFFSALGDLSFAQIKTLAHTCNEIRVDAEWVQVADHQSQVLINHLSYVIPVHGWSKLLPQSQTNVSVERKYSEPILWTFGCSHTAGVGLDNPQDQCYGKLLADRLGMHWQNIAKPGSSAMWSLTHLLHADIQSQDMVVWAVTSPDRDRLMSNNQIVEFRTQNMSQDMMGYYTDEQVAFRHIFNVNCGVKYLRAKAIRSMMFSLLPDINYNSHQVFNYQLELNFSTYPEWCPTVDWHIDKGNDGAHPGPKTHQYLANLAYDHFKLLKYI